MEYLLLGAIIGLIGGVYIGYSLPKTTINNTIKKLKTKGDNSPIDAINKPTFQQKRKGFLKRIFTKRKKK